MELHNASGRILSISSSRPRTDARGDCDEVDLGCRYYRMFHIHLGGSLLVSDVAEGWQWLLSDRAPLISPAVNIASAVLGAVGQIHHVRLVPGVWESRGHQEEKRDRYHRCQLCVLCDHVCK